MSRLINLIAKGDLTEPIAKKVLAEMFDTGKGPDTIIEEKDLKPVSDNSLIDTILDEIASENPEAVSQIKAGETKPIDFLLGQVMRKTKGKANPKFVRERIVKRFNIE